MGTTTSRPPLDIRITTRKGTWGHQNGGGIIGRDSNILGKDYGIFCQPLPECLKGDFLGKLGLEGKEARKGQK